MKLQPATKATTCNSQRVTYTFAAFALTLCSDIKHFSLPEIISECVLSSMECKLQLLLQTLGASLFLDVERCKEQKLCRLCTSCVDFGVLKQGTLQSREAFAKISIRSRARKETWGHPVVGAVLTPNSAGEVSTSLIENCWTN